MNNRIDNIFKIGNNYIFDTNTGNGYKVIRENGEVTNFKYQYTLREMDTDNIFENINKSDDIPIGVLRRSAELMQLKKENKLIVSKE